MTVRKTYSHVSQALLDDELNQLTNNSKVEFPSFYSH